MATKKTLCIQDMSCIGRCSLTVISPVLSAKGIQCVPMPTAVLSTHYGGFGQVADCVHERFIIYKDKFMAKTNNRGKEQ